MTVSKVYYYERASIFDRGLILLLGIACIFLVNMKNNCPPCKEYDKVLDAINNKEANMRSANGDLRRTWESSSSSLSNSRGSTYKKDYDSSSSSSYASSSSSAGKWKENDWKHGSSHESWKPYGSGSTKKKSYSDKSHSSKSSDGKSSYSNKKSDGGSFSELSSDENVALTEKSSSSSSSKQGGSKKKSDFESKNWQEGWKEKNKEEIKKRMMERKGTLPGGIPADTLWKNKYDIVHIMTTRYMQLQPDLMHLGKARNDLFRTFTLPSVVAQTTQEFIWIIFTDPDLNKELLDEVVNMIKPYKNIILLGMNNGMSNFRSHGWMNNIEKVFSGDLQLLKDYRVASKSRVLLETRIDADDSIFVEMMDSVQRQAAETMGKRAKEANYDKDLLSKEYRIFCTEHHLEWGYFNPWEKSSLKGHLFGVSHEEFCISAGLTYGYQVGTDKDTLPTVSHHKMSVKIPTCKRASNNRNCLERIDAGDYKYIMLRSRTPTSAGMLGVIPTKQVVESEEWKAKQQETWDGVIEKNFAIKPEDIFQLRTRLKKNMVDILTDALKGQCTKAEFTCKDQTKRDLNNLLAEVQKHDS